MEISPSHAGRDGCSAESVLVHEESTPGGFFRGYKFVATPRGRWVFDHWEITAHGFDEWDGTRTREFSGTYDADGNPYENWGGWSERGSDEWSIDEELHQLGHHHTEKTITNIVAVFRPIGFGSPLCDRDGNILYGDSGILFDG